MACVFSAFSASPLPWAHDSCCSLVGYLGLVAEETNDGQAMQPIIFEQCQVWEKCKGCGQKILNRELRYGQLVSHPAARNVGYYKYYHISCVGSDAVIRDDIGFFAASAVVLFSEPSVILKCDDFHGARPFEMLCRHVEADTDCPVVDVTQFSDFENCRTQIKKKWGRHSYRNMKLKTYKSSA